MLNRKMLKEAYTVAAWDWNAALGDTIKEKYEGLYVKIVEVENVLKSKAKGDKVNLDAIVILTSPEIASVFSTSCSSMRPLKAVGSLTYQGTIGNRWILYTDPEMQKNKMLLGMGDNPNYHPKNCASITIANYPDLGWDFDTALNETIKEKYGDHYELMPQDDPYTLTQLASGHANLDLMAAHQFIQNENTGKGRIGTNDHESLYLLEYTPILPGTMTGTVYFGDTASATFVVNETGDFTFNTVKPKRTAPPVHGRLDLMTGEMFLAWPKPASINKLNLKPHCIVSYEYHYGQECLPEPEPQREFIITVGKKSLDTVGGLIEHLQQYDPNMRVAVKSGANLHNAASQIQSIKTYPKDKDDGETLVIKADPYRVLWIKP